MRALSSYRKTAGNSTSTPEQIFGVIVSLGYRREGHQAMSQADAARLFAVAMSNVNGGGKVWRLAGEKCSARFVEGPRGSVVGGSRRGVNEAFRALC